MYAFAALLTICVIVIEAAFARTDLSLQVVADHSSTTTPGFYKLTAMWSSQEGSLLLWAWVLSLTSSAVLFATRNKHRELAPWATAVLMGLGAFFTGLMLFDANPFARLNPVPPEGVGLEPLLRHPAMAIHPPMLYSGYVFFSIPFAFAIGALATRRLDASWIRATRRFALIAWLFLGVGILLGRPLVVLGARLGRLLGVGPGRERLADAVAGRDRLPALDHGPGAAGDAQGLERDPDLRHLRARAARHLPGALGHPRLDPRLRRVHGRRAAARPDRGGRDRLGAPDRLAARRTCARRSGSSRWSRARRSSSSTTCFWSGLAAVIFWGTFFPLISELFTGQKASLAAPWFDRYTTPLAILLVLFTGIGPLFAWRRVSLGAARRLLVAAGAGRRGGGGGVLVGVHRRGLAAAGAGHVRPRRLRPGRAGPGVRRAVPPPTGRSPGVPTRRRCSPCSLATAAATGATSSTPGVAVLLIAVAASSSFQTSRDLRLRPGQSATVDDYRITYAKPTAEISPAEQRLTFGSVLTVTKGGKPYATLYPSRNYYAGVGAPMAGGRAGAQLLRGRGDQRGRAQDHGRRRRVDGDAARPQPR